MDTETGANAGCTVTDVIQIQTPAVIRNAKQTDTVAIQMSSCNADVIQIQIRM